MKAKVDEIVESTSGKLVKGDGESVVTGVSTDTRTLAEGDLYVALEGPNFDGNKFAEGAVDSKAGALLLREGHPDISGTVERISDEAAVVLHPAPREALGMLANAQAGVAKPKSCYATPSGGCKRKHDGRGGDRKSALYKLQKQMGPTAAPQLK